MTRTDVNFWLDVVLLILFVALAWASLVIRFVFPPAQQAAGWTIWGWDFDRWCDLQFTLLSTLALAILIHLMLHWTWVCGVVANRFSRKARRASRDDGSRTLWGVGLILLIVNLVGLGIAAAALTITGPAS